MNVSIRKFEKKDISDKVRWINDPENNTYLHYDLPLNIEQTVAWFEKNKDRTDRYDAVIEVDNIPVGLIGLLSIDQKSKKAEYYVTLGEHGYKGKGVAKRASMLLLDYAFSKLDLNRVYLYTETENVSAIRLYERIGFVREGVVKKDIFSKGRFVDRYVYGITKDEFYGRIDTPIYRIGSVEGNELYIKREDFIPFSFGGNKARKAKLFFEKIDNGAYDCVVTYGSGSSNHCRVVANMAASRNLPCFIVCPEEASEKTYNSRLIEHFGAEFITCPVDKVHDTIENKLASLRAESYNPYFIAGGGHGNIGTQAYVECYEEILRYEKQSGFKFDYVFHASGTGTTQAGLVCGQLINREDRNIVGVSIARRNPRGKDVITDSVRDYLSANRIDFSNEDLERVIQFVDDYVGEGYGAYSDEIISVINEVMMRYGIPLDTTYTGKAFTGMLEYIRENNVTGKKILFIHTGGTPLYFDFLDR